MRLLIKIGVNGWAYLNLPASIGMRRRFISDCKIVQFYLLAPSLSLENRDTYAPASSGREIIRYILGMTA